MENTPQTVRERPGTAQERKLLMEQIAAYVDANLTGKITLKQVAAHFRISVSTVTQLFQRKGETTFHGFVTQPRMERARTLIYQGMPLEQVGRELDTGIIPPFTGLSGRPSGFLPGNTGRR